MSSSENTSVEKKAVLVQVNLYKQMREQLLAKLKIYQLQNKVELAKIISESIWHQLLIITLYFTISTSDFTLTFVDNCNGFYKNNHEKRSTVLAMNHMVLMTSKVLKVVPKLW